MMTAARFSVCPVISSHNGFHIRLCYQSFKSWQICLPHIFHRSFCVKLMADCLRTAVYCKMFGTGSCLHNRALSLKAFYEFHAQAGSQIRIFPVSLMTSSPAGIPENIHVGRPEGQSFVDISV